jgi:hypothetical protein
MSRQIKSFSLIAASAATLCISLPSQAGIITSSLGNAVHVDLEVQGIAQALVNLGTASGTAPSSYTNSNTVMAADAILSGSAPNLINEPGFNSDIDVTLIQGFASSTLDNTTVGNFTTIGSGRIEDMSLNVLHNIMPMLNFINVSASLLNTTSQIDAVRTAGSSQVIGLNIDVWGNSIDVSAFNNSPFTENFTLMDTLGLGIFLNEVSTSCTDSFCMEDRNALRISFDSFSLQQYVTDVMGQTFMGDDVLITGNIVLARSQAMTQVSEPSAAMLLVLGLALIGRRAMRTKK